MQLASLLEIREHEPDQKIAAILHPLSYKGKLEKTKMTCDNHGLFHPEMEDESADDSETERRGDVAPLPVVSYLLAAPLVSASEADVNGSFGRGDLAAGPACRRPIIGVCDRSYVNSMVRPKVRYKDVTLCQ